MVYDTGQSSHAVTIIVPTMASAERKAELARAIESVLNATVEKVSVIVCVNGNRSSADSIASIEAMPGVTVHRLAEPSLPKAIAFGRSIVRTPFFGFLDDDDQLLAGAIDARLRVLLAHEECDLVVSTGIRRNNNCDRMLLADLGTVSKDPLRALFKENWLPSCGALFRTASIGQQYFDDYHEYAEWTWLAYKLAIDGKRLATLDTPTFVVNDTEGSLSKGVAYRRAYLALFQRMLERNPPRDVFQLVRARIANQLHDLSCESLERGQIAAAIAQHLKSLLLPGGWRYVAYSRHIANALLKKSFRYS
jgi:glycosyltransferase involved in cell wall biosynthesis